MLQKITQVSPVMHSMIQHVLAHALARFGVKDDPRLAARRLCYALTEVHDFVSLRRSKIIWLGAGFVPDFDGLRVRES